MELNTVIDKTCICLHMKESNKQEAILQLSQTLFANGYLSNIEEFMKDVFMREEEGMTGIGDYIAIPHGKSKGVKKDKIAIGILNEPIQWESIDDLPVKIIILFAVNANDTQANTSHLAMMATVAKSLAHDDVKARLYQATTLEEVIKAFSNN